MIEIEEDLYIEEQINIFAENLNEELKNLNILLLLNGPYDKNNCILEVHSGAGGTEACDWAEMLYRMYIRWCEKKNYKIELLDYQAGDEAGIKSVSILIKGTNSYGYLKNEKGVHRLVRLSPFDSNNRRHTSFASIEVTPEIEQDSTIEIDEKDLKIDVYRSTGPRCCCFFHGVRGLVPLSHPFPQLHHTVPYLYWMRKGVPHPLCGFCFVVLYISFS